MTSAEGKPVAVSLRIGAPAGDIFQILGRSPGTLNSMVRGCCEEPPRGRGDLGVGDVFVMKMYYSIWATTR